LDVDENATITLRSKEGVANQLPKRDAMLSNLVKTSVEQDSEATEIPVPSVRQDILRRVVEYLRHHQGKEPPLPEKPLRSKNMKETCAGHPWDADFIDAIAVKRQDLYDLILAANYMDIKSLLHLGCAKVASLVRGVPLDQIKRVLDPSVASDKAEDAKDTN
jgi:S-phase kinase-associated protein 1